MTSCCRLYFLKTCFLASWLTYFDITYFNDYILGGLLRQASIAIAKAEKRTSLEIELLKNNGKLIVFGKGRLRAAAIAIIFFVCLEISCRSYYLLFSFSCMQVKRRYQL